MSQVTTFIREKIQQVRFIKAENQLGVGDLKILQDLN